MAAAIQLQLEGHPAPFVFDVQGSFFPRVEAEYRENSHPRQVTALRETWEFRQCRLVSDDDSVASVWAKVRALKAHLSTRASPPVRARLVSDPGGAGVVLLTLGPPTHESFQVDLLEGETDELAPAASFRKVATFSLRVSAVLKLADTRGLVSFDQQVEVTYEDGRQGIEARTRVTTAEGTSAVQKAQAYARLVASNFGNNYLYETNGPDGIDYVVLDDDRLLGRVPTVVDAVSRVRAYGISFGQVTPGSCPSSVSYSISTKTSATETQTVTRAEARGPGAWAFVLGKRPHVYSEKEETRDDALFFASGVWTESHPTSGKVSEGLKATVSGGRATDWEPAMNNVPAVLFAGGFSNFTAVVEVTREHLGADATRETLLFPGLPGEGWELDRLASSEDEEPELVSEGVTPSQSRWRRTARLVLKAGRLPATPVLVLMKRAPEVESYLQGAA